MSGPQLSPGYDAQPGQRDGLGGSLTQQYTEFICSVMQHTWDTGQKAEHILQQIVFLEILSGAVSISVAHYLHGKYHRLQTINLKTSEEFFVHSRIMVEWSNGREEVLQVGEEDNLAPCCVATALQLVDAEGLGVAEEFFHEVKQFCNH